MKSTQGLPSLAGVDHEFVQLPGLRMHVAEAGSGDPVLLLHGFPQHWMEWEGIIPALADRYHLIAPDLRGSGWTDAPAAGYTRDQLLADVVALLDAKGLDRVHLIAHDFGMIIGYQLCLAHPERVRSYVSLGPHPFMKFNPRMLKGMRRLWFQFVIAIPGLGPRLLGHGKQPMARYLFHNSLADSAIWSEERIRVFTERLRDPARARAASALYRRFILPEIGYVLRGWYRKSGLVTPTHVLHGAEELAVPAEFLSGYEEYTEDMALEIVPGASHYLADAKPDVVARAARELFAAH